MKILSIDTSTKNLSLAINENEKLIRYRNEILGYKLSESLVGRIDQILKKACISLNQLDGIAIGLGPGSFTSLRVGLATVKGLSFVKKIPLVGISSLDVLASGFKGQGDNICALSDAKRDMVYLSRYEKKGQKIKKAGNYQLLAIKDFNPSNFHNTLFVGDGIPLIRDRFAKKLKGCDWAKDSFWFPQARHLGRLSLEKFEKNQLSDGNRLKPLYLYPQDCQVRI